MLLKWNDGYKATFKTQRGPGATICFLAVLNPSGAGQSWKEQQASRLPSSGPVPVQQSSSTWWQDLSGGGAGEGGAGEGGGLGHDGVRGQGQCPWKGWISAGSSFCVNVIVLCSWIFGVSLDPAGAQARGDAVWILREARGLRYSSFRYCCTYQENSSRLEMWSSWWNAGLTCPSVWQGEAGCWGIYSGTSLAVWKSLRPAGIHETVSYKKQWDGGLKSPSTFPTQISWALSEVAGPTSHHRELLVFLAIQWTGHTPHLKKEWG